MSTEETHHHATEPEPSGGVIYARVSSQEQQQGFSIQAQQELFRTYGAQHNIVIEREFVDVHSAKKPGRPGFTEMLQYLRKNPGCRVILVEKTDRLYRNWADAVTVEALVEELGVQIHLVKEGQIYSKASGAADKYRHGMDVLNAKRYIDNLSEEVQKGLRTKAANGIWPSYAPLGYHNTMGDYGKKIIVSDAVLGPIVTQLFAWFATGEYSLQSLALRAYEEGFRFRKSGYKVPVSTLHKVLHNRVYMGEFDYGGVRYQGCHEPLVMPEVWERVQAVLAGRHRKSHGGKHELAYAGMVRCGRCGCSMVGEVKKGRYTYYHCTGYRGKCGEPYTREETLQKEFAEGLQELSVPPEIARWLEVAQVESERSVQAGYTQALRRHQEELQRLQGRQDMMYDDRLEGRIDAATYDQRCAQMQVQREQIREQMQNLNAAMPALTGEAVDLGQVMSQVGELFLEQSATEQHKLLRLVVKTASWKDGRLQIAMREPFAWLRRAPQPAIVEQSENVDQPATAKARPVDALPLGDSLAVSEIETADEFWM